MASVDKRPNGQWRARWRVPRRSAEEKHFPRKPTLSISSRYSTGSPAGPTSPPTCRGGRGPRRTPTRQPWRDQPRVRMGPCSLRPRRGGRPSARVDPTRRRRVAPRRPRPHSDHDAVRRSVISSYSRGDRRRSRARNPVAGVKVVRSTTTIHVPTTAEVVDVLERAGARPAAGDCARRAGRAPPRWRPASPSTGWTSCGARSASTGNG